MAQQPCLHLTTAQWPQCSTSYCCTSVSNFITYSRQENSMDTGACSRVMFDQYRWGTLNNPASALYCLTHASRAARPLLQGPGCWPSAYFWTQSGQIRLQSFIGSKKRFRTIAIVFDPIGSKNLWRDFLQLGPWRSRKQPWEDLWKTLRPNLRRGWQFIWRFRGERSLANVLKCTFPTNCTSNCISGDN